MSANALRAVFHNVYVRGLNGLGTGSDTILVQSTPVQGKFELFFTHWPQVVDLSARLDCSFTQLGHLHH